MGLKIFKVIKKKFKYDYAHKIIVLAKTKDHALDIVLEHDFGPFDGEVVREDFKVEEIAILPENIGIIEIIRHDG